MFDAEPSPGQVSLPYGHPSYYGAIAPNADNQPTPSFHKVETSNTTQFSSDEENIIETKQEAPEYSE